MRDIVGLYLNPPDHAVVLSFDEKPQIQALERAQPILPMDMGRPERQTHNYIRHGTVDLFAALNVATGQVVAQTKKQHRSRDFVSFLREIDERVDPTLTVHVILDNLSAHKSPLVTRWVARHPRFQFHFTPTYSAWLNLAGAYEARGDTDRAREIYTAALSANPADEHTRLKLTEMGVDVASLLPDVEVAPETLARYEGQYRLTAERVVTIRVEDGELTTQTTGSFKRPMRPLSETQFFIEGVEAQYHFTTNATGEAESLSVHQFGREVIAPRIDK